jgi:hypothetical protein
MGDCEWQTRDRDGDAHGDERCLSLGGVPADDCDDSNYSIAPGTAESCNGVDDNCDGSVDEGCLSCDACVGGEFLPGGTFLRSLSTVEHTGSCGGDGAEAVFSFVALEPSDLFVTTHRAEIDTVVYVRSCECTETELGCNDDADGRRTSALQLTDLPPGSYDVFVDTKSTMSAAVPVDIYVTPTGQMGDECARPIPIAPGASSLSGDTCGFSGNYEPSAEGSCTPSGTGVGPDTVYYFYLPSSRAIIVDGCTAGTTYDTTLYIRKGCLDTAPSAEVVCNEDGCDGARQTCTTSLRSYATSTLEAGLYYLFVDGYSGGTVGSTPTCPCGPYQLDLTGF